MYVRLNATHVEVEMDEIRWAKCNACGAKMRCKWDVNGMGVKQQWNAGGVTMGLPIEIYPNHFTFALQVVNPP